MESNTDAAQMKIDEDSWVIQKTKIDEDSWVIQIKESLDALQEEEEENVKGFCISVFNVPKELLADKPEAYIPQMVSIGPSHHWRSLHDMDHYKLATACRFQKKMKGLEKFQSVNVEEFKKYDWHVRSCYHKFIDYKEETLAWIMALDAVFLFQCLQFYVRHADQSFHLEVKSLGRVLDLTGTSAFYKSILRDLMMLENQMPLFLMLKLLELELGCEANAEQRLSRLLCLMVQELSPFSYKLPESGNLRIKERRHLLEVLYYCIVPSDNQIPIRFDEGKDAPYPADMSAVNPTLIEEKDDSPDLADSSTVKGAFSMLWQTLSSMNVGVARFLTMLLRRALNSKPSQFVMKLPFLLILSTIERLEKDAVTTGEESSVKLIQPSPQELNIPSVADLHFAGVKFSPTDGDLGTIQFDEKTATLYLPRVKLDSNTEVILRNLVAFEASAAPGALVWRRYTDFMNGMIDGVKDVKLLRESGIICIHLQSDGEVASLWNSMGKCVRPKEAGYLDKVIKDLNGYYSRKWKVLAVKFVNNHIFSSWKFLSLAAAAMLLITTCLQAYCSVYNCKHTALSINAKTG